MKDNDRHGIIFWCLVIFMTIISCLSSCSEESELPEIVDEASKLRGTWLLQSREVVTGNDIQECSGVSNISMTFKAGDIVERSHRLNCNNVMESGIYYPGNLKTIVFSTYVIDLQNFSVTNDRLSFEYPVNLDDDGNPERVREIYIKK